MPIVIPFTESTIALSGVTEYSTGPSSELVYGWRTNYP